MQQELAIWLNRALQEVDPVLLMNANRGWAKLKNAEPNPA
jgi:DNA helicase TIP49 (TBP-interacting protein)